MTQNYNDMSDDELLEQIENIKEKIQDLREHLVLARKAHDERRYSNLRTLLENQRENNKAIRDEMIALGGATSKMLNPYSFRYLYV
jgi:ribosomal protein S15P/S13E